MRTVLEKVNTISEGITNYVADPGEGGIHFGKVGKGGEKFDPTGIFWKYMVMPEVGGYQIPGVAKKIGMVAPAVAVKRALDRGAGPGAVMGAGGGALLGGAFGGVGAAGYKTGAAAKIGKEGALRALVGRKTEVHGGRHRWNLRDPAVMARLNRHYPQVIPGPVPQRDPMFGRKLKGKAKALAMAITAGAGLAKAGLGALSGAALGSASGALSGYVGGRSAGAGILGGGALAAGAVLPALGIQRGARAFGPAGKGFKYLAPATLGIAGYGGGVAGSDIMKTIERTRKRLARGGPEGLLFPSSTTARRVG